MIKTRGRKILRDILARKGRTALVSLSIMIGVFGAVTMVSGNDLLIKQIKEDIKPSEVAMTRLYVSTPTGDTPTTNENGQDQILDLVRNTNRVPGVTRIEAQVVLPAFWQQVGSGERFREGTIVANSEPFGEIQIEPMRKIEGDWPQADQREVAVDRRMAEEYDLKVGDKLLFKSVKDDLNAEWTITAVVFQPYWVGDEDSDATKFIFTSFANAQRITGVTGFWAYYLRYIDTGTAHSQADYLMSAVADNTSYIPGSYWLDNPDDYFLIGEVKSVTNVLNILAIVCLIVSGFLVMNVINTIIVEQKRQIGVMKSMGATRWDNFVVYSGIALAYGVLGTIPGVILGVLVGSELSKIFAPLAYTYIQGFNVSTVGILIGLVMGLLVPVIAAMIPVLNGMRVSILDAMTDLGISGSWGKSWLSRLIARLPLPINIRQALSNVSQKKSRLALTAITLTLAAGAFMGVFAVFTAIADELDKLYDTLNYEVVVNPIGASDMTQVQDALASVPKVGSVYPGVGFDVSLVDPETNITIEMEDENISAIGVDPSQPVVNLTYDSGTGWDGDPTREGIVMTRKVADYFHKKVGDKVLLDVAGNRAEYTLIGISSFVDDIIFMQWQDLARLAGFVSSDNGTPDDYTDDTPVPTIFFATLKNRNATGTETDDVIAEMSDRLLENGISANYYNQQKDAESVAEDFKTFNLIFQITSGIMAAVGAIGLLTTLSMAVFERQKEIGVMRSIGARSFTIVSQFLVEGLIIGLIAWLLAVPISYLLAKGLISALDMSDFEFHYPVWVLGLGLGGMLAIAFVASLWPSIAASRKTVSDILRYQ